jgi:hypothetical protein
LKKPFRKDSTREDRQRAYNIRSGGENIGAAAGAAVSLDAFVIERVIERVLASGDARRRRT